MTIRQLARGHFAACTLAVLGSLTGIVAACGRGTDSASEMGSTDELRLLGEPSYAKRFTPAEIAALYTDEIDNGQPVNQPFLTELFTSPDQAPDLAEEFGDFSNAGEIKAFLNLGTTPGILTKTRLVVALEGVSLWDRILDDENKPLFKETFSIDAAGNKINDSIDGKLPNNEQLQFGRLKMQVSIATISADMKIFTQDLGNHLQIKMSNERDIKAPFVGTVIKKDGFRIHLELYPYQKGYLTYGVTTAKLEQFADKLTPEILSSQVTSIFNWLHGKLIGK